MKITIENYEEFYLDYLEKSLNEQDQIAFETFLLMHPELRIESDDFLSLISNNEELSVNIKRDLKITEGSEFTLIEGLMIGEMEEINSIKESEFLYKRLQNNPLQAREFVRYKSTKIATNLNEIFENRRSLKKREIVVLWPWLSAVAAIAILFFTVYKFNSNDEVMVAKKNKLEGNQVEKQRKTPIVYPAMQQAKSTAVKPLINNRIVYPSNVKIEQKDKIESPALVEDQIENEPLIVDQLPQQIDQKKEEHTPEMPEMINGLNSVIVSTAKEKNTSNYHFREYNSMPNPASGLTTIAQKIIGSEVDYRTAKPSKRVSGGTHLKIGKFEYSRRKR
jgi:hypothetical protein